MRRARTSTKKAPDAGIPEAEISASILAAAAALGIPLWRNNVGATLTAGGGFMRFGLGNDGRGRGGSPDLIGILPGGRFLGVEVKAARGKISPEQAAWIERINAAGGLAFVARSVDDFLREIYLPRRAESHHA
jgi:VRR-NUC domain